MPTTTIGALLQEARATYERVDANTAYDELRAGALLVDVRAVHHRRLDGEIPGALIVDRNVLEWRLDPAGEHRIDRAHRGARVILICNEGYATSLAAATLRRMGLDATDVIDGMQGWMAAGLPVTR